MVAFLIIIFVASSVWVLCLILSDPSSKLYVLDNPNDRSLHADPKPHVGGVAIISSIFIAWLMIAVTQYVNLFNFYMLVGLSLLSIISYVDDRYSISQIWRLTAHLLAAILLVCSGIGLSENDIRLDNIFALNILTILVIVWCVNLYNFMDGMDGLAGGMGVIGFGCLAWFGWFAGDDLFFLMALITAAANMGFLLHNFPPAKIFMGDVGSISMGYLVAFFSLWGMQAKIFAWWMPVLIFSPFIVDATVTLVKRLFCGEKIWEAHKSHYYQKLVQIGWGHKRTTIFEYVLMVAVACSAMVMKAFDSEALTIYLLMMWLLIYVLIIYAVSQIIIRSGNFR